MGDPFFDEHDDDTPEGYPYYSNITDDYSVNTFQVQTPFLVAIGSLFLFIFGLHIYKQSRNEESHPLRDRLCNRIDIQKKDIIYEDGPPHVCSICLEEYKKNDKLVQLKCKHVYHPGCINDWLDRQSSCPICRSEII